MISLLLLAKKGNMLVKGIKTISDLKPIETDITQTLKGIHTDRKITKSNE